MLDAETPRHALVRAEEVDCDRHVVAAYVLEQQRRTAGLDRPVRDLRDLQLAADRRADPAKLAPIVEESDEVPKILELHPAL